MIPSADTGFVQVIVVSALATIGGLVTASLIATTKTNQQTAALERLVRNEAIGISGSQRLAAAIDDPADALEAQALWGTVATKLANIEISFRIEPEGSKIDVLAAELGLIEGYASQVGLDPRSTTTLLGEIGKARGRSDGVTALEAVRVAMTGMLPAEGLDRDFTRFGGAGIDPSYASSRVLHAIPDLSPADADRIAATTPDERAQHVHLSRYFSSGGRRFTLVTQIAWSANETSERRLPIEISTSGKIIVLAGPY